MPPLPPLSQDAHMLTSGTGDSVITIFGIKVVNQLILDREIVLDYLPRPNAITKVLKSGRRGQRVSVI